MKYIFSALLITLLTGCGTATKVTNLPANLNPAITTGKSKISVDTVISIQFPMALSENAKNQLIKAYPCKFNEFLNHPLSGCGGSGFTGSMAPMLAEQSTYYAAELKELLGQYIDPKSIFLEPFAIDYKDGDFIEKPMLSINTPSSIFLKVYDFPQTVKASIGAGPLLSSSIRTAGSASPKTCGNLFVAGESQTLPKSKTKCTSLDARNTPTIQPLHFFAEHHPTFAEYPKNKESPITPNTILTLPLLYQENNDKYLKKSAEPGFQATAQSIYGPEMNWLARATVNALLKINTQNAFDTGFATYLQGYDTGLTDRFRQGALISGDDHKIAVAHKLLEAERDWLAHQNAAITNGILNGNYGKSFRQSRWVLAQAYNKSQALGWLQVGAVLAGGFSSGLFGGATAYNPGMLMLSNLQTEQRFSSMQNQIEQALLETLAPGLDMRSKVVQISIDGINTPLHGSSHGEIREQLLSLYKKLAGT